MNLPFYAPLIAGPRIFNLPQLLLLFHLHLAGCPSGQRELTVNQPSSTSWVQIPHPPQIIRPGSVWIRAEFVFTHAVPPVFGLPAAPLRGPARSGSHPQFSSARRAFAVRFYRFGRSASFLGYRPKCVYGPGVSA